MKLNEIVTDMFSEEYKKLQTAVETVISLIGANVKSVEFFDNGIQLLVHGDGPKSAEIQKAIGKESINKIQIKHDKNLPRSYYFLNTVKPLTTATAKRLSNKIKVPAGK